MEHGMDFGKMMEEAFKKNTVKKQGEKALSVEEEKELERGAKKAEADMRETAAAAEIEKAQGAETLNEWAARRAENGNVDDARHLDTPEARQEHYAEKLSSVGAKPAEGTVRMSENMSEAESRLSAEYTRLFSLDTPGARKAFLNEFIEKEIPDVDEQARAMVASELMSDLQQLLRESRPGVEAIPALRDLAKLRADMHRGGSEKRTGTDG